MWVLFFVVCLILVKQKKNVQKGLDSCLKNVQATCGPLIEYTVLLENENAKLNKKIRQCSQK